jgi:hypothetical protein
MVYFDTGSGPSVTGLFGGGSDTTMIADTGTEEESETQPQEKMDFLVLLWQKTPKGQWLLEGNKTLQYSNKPKPAPAKPAPGPRSPKGRPRYYGWDGGITPFRGHHGSGPSPAVSPFPEVAVAEPVPC